MSDKLRLALLISGGGTTACSIIRACKSGRLGRVEPACVIASKPDAGGLEKVHAEGVQAEHTAVCNPRLFRSRDEFGDALLALLKQFRVDLVGQYGWLPLTPQKVVNAYRGMIINQHPGPLDPGRPDFGGKGMYGRRVHCARLYFVRRTGAGQWTEAVGHRVTEEYDKGAVLRVHRVPILDDDDPLTLQQRALPVEHEVQIELLDDFANDQVHEVTRDHPLVEPWLEHILAKAKTTSFLLFPRG